MTEEELLKRWWKTEHYFRVKDVENKVAEIRKQRNRDRLNEQLKPCPFCGGDAELVDSMRLDGNCHYRIKFVRCKSCGARSKEFTVDGYYGEEPHPDEEIIGVWNNRV